MFIPSWSAKIEYDYYDFGSKDAVVSAVGFGPNLFNSKLTVNTVKAGVNYHFNLGEPRF
jgi:outer membrane immunogenic protein